MFLKTELTTTHDVVTVMATNVGAVVELTSKSRFLSLLVADLT